MYHISTIISSILPLFFTSEDGKMAMESTKVNFTTLKSIKDDLQRMADKHPLHQGKIGRTINEFIIEGLKRENELTPVDVSHLEVIDADDQGNPVDASPGDAFDSPSEEPLM